MRNCVARARRSCVQNKLIAGNFMFGGSAHRRHKRPEMCKIGGGALTCVAPRQTERGSCV